MRGSHHHRVLILHLGWVWTLAVLLNGCSGGMEPDVPASIILTPDSLSFIALGQTQQLEPELRDAQGNLMTGLPVTWISSDPGVVSVRPRDW